MSHLYCIIGLFLLYSCNNNKPVTGINTEQTTGSKTKTEEKYINSIQISVPQKNAIFQYNDVINILLDNREKPPIDSIHLFLNGKKIATGGKDMLSFQYKLPEDKTGNATLKAIAFHPDNKQGIATQTIRIKPDKAPVKHTYEVIRTYTHDPKAYTQGLVYDKGYMYESTGQYGESGIRKSDMKNGKILSTLNIDNKLFGEGITIYQDKIYQLTWTSHQGFVYDLKSFSLESTFNYNMQGWGITTAGDELIMSDGSHKIYHIAPTSFSVIRETEVYDHNGPVKNLNELEYINGLLWANVWMTDRIVIIDPETGCIKGELDMSKLLSTAERQQLNDTDDVLNGIAWNPEKGTIYVTGKRWPKLFEIKIADPVR